jgi:hypothetical protein
MSTATVSMSRRTEGRGVLAQLKKGVLAGAFVFAATLTSFAAEPASAAGGVAWMYDVDNNGVVDPSSFDVTGPNGVPDGYLDQNNIVLPTPIGPRLAWLIDLNEDSVPEQYLVDGNNDGVGDVLIYDYNEDGVLDSYWTDPAVYPPVQVVAAQPGGLTINIASQPLGTDPGAVVPEGLSTNPCAPFTWTLPDNMVCRS